METDWKQENTRGLYPDMTQTSMNLDRHSHRGGRVWKLKCQQVNKPKTSFDSL